MIHTTVNLLFGCRHKQTTRPIPPVHKVAFKVFQGESEAMRL